MSRFFQLFLIFCSGLMSLVGAANPPATGASTEPSIKIATLETCFSHLDKSAALLAPKLIVNYLQETLKIPVEAISYDSSDLLGHEIKVGSVRVVALMGDTLAKGAKAGWTLEPVLMTSDVADAAGEWLLLAPKGTDPAKIASSRIVVVDASQGDLPLLWFEQWRRNYVTGSALPTPRRESNAEAAIIRTFLGKETACLVPIEAYRQASTSNVGIAYSLQSVANSPAWPGMVICLSGPVDSRPAGLTDAIKNLPRSPHGLALAKLLRTNSLNLFDDRMLTGIYQVFSPAETAPAAPASTPSATRSPKTRR